MAQKMSWQAAGKPFRASLSLMLLVLLLSSGCAQRPRGWGFPGGSGTIERQKARASIHDPYPLSDLGPDVTGGRPRGFAEPRSEAAREANIPRQYRNLPQGY